MRLRAATWMTTIKKLFAGVLIFCTLLLVYMYWTATTHTVMLPPTHCTQRTYHTHTALQVVPASYSPHLTLVQLVQTIEGDPASNTRYMDATNNTVDRSAGSNHTSSDGSSGSNEETHRAASISIAIALGITSATLDPHMSRDDMMKMFPTFTQLLPSFCNTVSCGYIYHFYFAYDMDDAFFITEQQRNMFIRQFQLQVQQTCPHSISVNVHMLQCYHSRRPAWAQNDAAYAAYLHGADYVYRVNDDSVMNSVNWADIFIHTLQQMNPPNIGVVGPTHTGGATDILTYDFTHRSHIEIFGFQYPRLFIDWSGDSWITFVYKPGRLAKLKEVKLQHSMVLGRRYENHSKAQQLPHRLSMDKETLRRYLVATEVDEDIKSDPSHVIVMSLYGDNYNYTNGAIRNAQLRQVFFPEWTLRIYMPNPCCCDYAVPDPYVEQLLRLGAEVIFVNTSHLSISLKHMNLMVALDSNVKRFLIRNPEQRFSDRDSMLVKEWITSGENFLMVRDHETQERESVIAGQYAAVRVWFVHNLQLDITELLVALHNGDREYLEKKHVKAGSSFEDILWDKVSTDAAMYRDSVSCSLQDHIYFKPRTNTRESFIGEKFDGFGEVANSELHNILSSC